MVVLFAAGFFMFLFGLTKFMLNLSRGAKSDEGKKHMLWGTIGMTIMVSGYGIVALIDNTIHSNAANPSQNAQAVLDTVRLK